MVEVAHEERHVRTPGSLPVFAAFACMALVGVTVASAHVPSQADPLTHVVHRDGQSYAIKVDAVDAVTRDGFRVIKIVTAKPAPAAGIPDPGTAQGIALEMVTARGWGSTEFDCLVALWNRESHWNVYSLNTSSGAYGIPQALPGSKMASVGADWATNPATQIAWGLGYITGRYGTPCGAWNHSQAKGWY
ncbi:MAG TPA: lytic transglycosylase domain-containing protein [Pseudolysinimonas sp.]|nr:lytic transglycosylase domain-containing protein [Pseudolysinimonas sp.]